MLSKCYLQNKRTILSCRIDRILHHWIILMHHEEIWTKRAHIMTEFVNLTMHNGTRIILMDMSFLSDECRATGDTNYLFLFCISICSGQRGQKHGCWCPGYKEHDIDYAGQRILVFHEELFRLPASSQCRDTLEMPIYILISQNESNTS